MARSIFVNGWNIPIRLADFNFIEAARNGEVGTGGFNLDSENAGVTINSHWGVTALETSSGSNTNLYHGYVADLTLQRGPFAIDKDRQFDTNIVDLNTLLIDDIMTGSSANRPEETDIARVTWLVGTSFLSGMGSTIGASGATTLEAADFRTQNPLQLLTQAAETAGKLFFVYWDLATAAPKLFYDLATASNFITSSKISTYLPDGSNSQTHHPRKDSLRRNLDGGRIYSELLFKYDGGSVTVTNAATASNYRARKTVIYDNNVKSAAQATRKANQFLNSVSSPEDVITLDVDLTATQVNEFRAGQLMQIKAPHLGLPTFVDRRIVRTEKKPRFASGPNDQEDYTVTMELSVPKSNRFGASGVPAESLPDSVGNQPPTNSAATTTGTCFNTQNYVGVGQTEFFGANATGVPGHVASSIYYNVPYTNGDGCAAPYGGWRWFSDEELRYQFTAPADSSTVLGLTVTTSLDFLAGASYTGDMGIMMGVGYGAPAAGQFGIFNPVGTINPLVYAPPGLTIPRNLIKWGEVNTIVFHPTWRCDRPNVFACVNLPNGPVTIGANYFNSGTYSAPSLFINLCTQVWSAGTGMSNWVAGYGVTNGLNTTFRLIGWDGHGIPEVMLNGINIEEGVTFDTTNLTGTLSFAPVEGSILLWNYSVSV